MLCRPPPLCHRSDKPDLTTTLFASLRLESARWLSKPNKCKAHLPVLTAVNCLAALPATPPAASSLVLTQADADSDALVESFQAGSMTLEQFVEQYVSSRDLYHTVDLKRQASEHHVLLRTS
jgi:hypothetical protein